MVVQRNKEDGVHTFVYKNWKDFSLKKDLEISMETNSGMHGLWLKVLVELLHRETTWPMGVED